MSDAPAPAVTSASGVVKTLTEFVSRHKVAAVLGSVAGSVLLNLQLNDLFTTALWFPPAWRRFSVFLLLTIGGATFFVVRSTLRARDSLIESAPANSGARQADVRRKAWSVKFWIAVLAASALSYVMLRHACVVDLGPLSAEESPAGAPSAITASTAASPKSDSVASDDEDDRYLMLPLWRPEWLEDYAKRRKGLQHVLGEDAGGIRGRLESENPFLMGLTSATFLAAFLGIVVSFAALFSHTFDPAKTLTKEAAKVVLH